MRAAAKVSYFASEIEVTMLNANPEDQSEDGGRGDLLAGSCHKVESHPQPQEVKSWSEHC